MKITRSGMWRERQIQEIQSSFVLRVPSLTFFKFLGLSPLLFDLSRFSGIMFPLKAKENVPVSQIVVHSVAVRGQLGPLTVWVTQPEITPRTTNRNGNNNSGGSKEYHFPLHPRNWIKIYQRVHGPSMREYQWLDFSQNPIIMRPGQVRALYIHSTLQGDEAIVYDNASVRPHHWHYGAATRRMPTVSPPRYTDAFVSLLTGKAHLSPRPFGHTPIWGWGNSWRDHREFVGQVRYGVRFRLWQPSLTGDTYGPEFRRAVQTLLGCQRRAESPISLLPDACLYYIVNMCKWDWWNDTANDLKAQRRRLQRQRRLAAAAAPPPVPAAASAVQEVTNPTATSLETSGDGCMETNAPAAASGGGANDASTAEDSDMVDGRRE